MPCPVDDLKASACNAATCNYDAYDNLLLIQTFIGLNDFLIILFLPKSGKSVSFGSNTNKIELL